MTAIDLSLTRICSLSTHLTPYTRPTIHIAGTNGKGSVSALLTSILCSSLRIGRFNSPHLVHIHDSITINNNPISLSTYTAARYDVEHADRTHGTHLSSFELLTLTALRVFESEAVDIVILEVGMGGLLDATNVIPTPAVLCSALTAVDLDHQAFLGTTIAEIARQKAGISRPARPFVLGPQGDPAVHQVVDQVVRQAGGILRSPTRVHTETSSPLSLPPLPQPIHAILESFPDRSICASLPLQGEHQLDNLSTTLGIIDTLLFLSKRPTADPDLIRNLRTLNLPLRLTPEAIERGIRDVQWPGRLSFHLLHIPNKQTTTTVPLLVLADGAHNAASARTLGAYLTRLLSDIPGLSITYILALSHSPPKSPHDTLAPMIAPVLTSSRLASPSSHPPPLSSSPPRSSPPPPSSCPSASAAPDPKPAIALLSFSPPAGMPWVRPVDPHVLRDTVSQIVRSSGSRPGSGSGAESPTDGHLSVDGGNSSSSSSEIGAVEVRIFDNDQAQDRDRDKNASGPANAGRGEGEGYNCRLVDALHWAAARSRAGDTDTTEAPHPHPQARELVVLAGSLYLVADLYRLLEGGFGSES